MNNIYTSSKLNTIGESVQGYEDLSQSIGIILSTQKGSMPHAPLFGVDHLKYVDRPIDTIKGTYTAEIVDALAMWEERVEVVSVQMEQQEAELTVTVSWRPTGENILFKQDYAL